MLPLVAPFPLKRIVYVFAVHCAVNVKLPQPAGILSPGLNVLYPDPSNQLENVCPVFVGIFVDILSPLQYVNCCVDGAPVPPFALYVIVYVVGVKCE